MMDGQQDDKKDLTRRQSKKDRTATALAWEALRLFSKQGYEETSVEQIAEAANVSRRTLFRYFSGKGDIILAWTSEMTEALKNAIASASPDASLQDMVLLALLPVVHRITANREYAYALVQLLEHEPALRSVSLQKYEEWEEALAKALMARLPPTDMPSLAARLIARTAIATYRTAVDEWMKTEGEANLEDLLRRAFTFHPLLWMEDSPLSLG
ncbi:TetR family transcriptional regulator [Gluconobacter japonicus]|nr:TetR family transcriptional regulator [Gluconobacter japonicus]KXV29202.1 transcriptional regulator [Gluconobacter japonicus]MDI6651989.1 TetR family transcriptional regulator [Gluconobacter japonicus]GAP23693.1 transcriptional regulator [Gluconobacter frateurii NBRC 101659]